jgi:hypothetical protein
LPVDLDFDRLVDADAERAREVFFDEELDLVPVGDFRLAPAEELRLVAAGFLPRHPYPASSVDLTSRRA